MYIDGYIEQVELVFFFFKHAGYFFPLLIVLFMNAIINPCTQLLSFISQLQAVYWVR